MVGKNYSAASNRRSLSFWLIGLLVISMLCLSTAQANAFTPVNQHPASLVLGQSDFTTRTSGTTNAKMNSPIGVTTDPTTGKVFVADYSNNRVLRFADPETLSNGSAAEAVLGNTSPPSSPSGAGATAASMNQPVGVTVDAQGRLWVADYGNSRVLRFDNASSIATGASADGVLGQADFTSRTPGVTQSTMNQPTGVFVDSNGTLWVADYRNNRILWFTDAATKADSDGANADGVVGQPDYTTSSSGLSDVKMNLPSTPFVDADDHLWVTENTNHRVLRFDDASTLQNGAAANGVLGQPDFTTNTAGAASASSLNGSFGLTMDDNGVLYVADRSHHRIVWFADAAAKANGADADGVIGQPDLTTGTAANPPSKSSLNSPYQVFYDAQQDGLWVGDSSNHRVLLYQDVTYILYFPSIYKQTSPGDNPPD